MSRDCFACARPAFFISYQDGAAMTEQSDAPDCLTAARRALATLRPTATQATWREVAASCLLSGNINRHSWPMPRAVQEQTTRYDHGLLVPEASNWSAGHSVLRWKASRAVWRQTGSRTVVHAFVVFPSNAPASPHSPSHRGRQLVALDIFTFRHRLQCGLRRNQCGARRCDDFPLCFRWISFSAFGPLARNMGATTSRACVMRLRWRWAGKNHSINALTTRFKLCETARIAASIKRDTHPQRQPSHPSKAARRYPKPAESMRSWFDLLVAPSHLKCELCSYSMCGISNTRHFRSAHF